MDRQLTPRSVADRRDAVLRKAISTIATNRVLGILLAGVACAVLAFCYSTILEFFLVLTWRIIPEQLIEPILKKSGWPEKMKWAGALYIVLVPTLYGLVVGASQSVLGAPGDMPETVESFNKHAYVDYTKVRWLLH
jgi:hypothetical protein